MISLLIRCMIVVCVILCLFGGNNSIWSNQVLAQTPPPTSTPTPVTGLAQLNAQPAFNITLNPDPPITSDLVEIHMSITARQSSSARCYGIPGQPLDIFVLVDNSASAGSGAVGSNLARTRELLQDFVTQSDQDVYVVDNLPERTTMHNRIGLISTHVMVTGTVMKSEPLESDYAKVREAVSDLGIGGDTDLTPGIRQAMNELQQDARPEAQPVLLLMLHDRLPTESNSVLDSDVLRDAQDAGIAVYLFSNSFNISEEQVVDVSSAQNLVEEDHFFADPTSEQLRKAFVQMTNGSDEWMAQALFVYAQWIPPVLKSSETVLGIENNQIVWWIPTLAAEEPSELEYEARLDDTLTGADNLQLQGVFSYLDCNGFLQTKVLADAFQSATPTPMSSTPTPIPSPTASQISVPTTPDTPSPSPLPLSTATILPSVTVSSEVAAAGTATPTGAVSVMETKTPASMPSAIPTLRPLTPVHTVLPPATATPIPILPPPRPPDLSGPFGWLLEMLEELGSGWLPTIPALSSLLTWLATVLPSILQWLLIIVLTLLLLFLLWRLFQMLKNLFGKKPPQQQPPQQQQPPPPPPPPPSSVPTLPRWIPTLEKNALLPNESRKSDIAAAKQHPIQDTLLVGVGPAGREVLAQVASALHDRFGPSCPENIRLLQVDVLPEGSSNNSLAPPPGLKTEQFALLRPDLTQIAKTQRQHPDKYPHWQWYTPGSERGQGRMTLFDDVKDQSRNSVLWKALERQLTDLNSPAIRVIGTTFDDVSSGMLVDITRLIQLVMKGDAKGNVEVQLWLAGPLGRDWSPRLSGRGTVRKDEQMTRTLATLRELGRFQRNAKRKFNYVQETNRQDVLRATYHYAVIGKVLVFEPAMDPPPQPENDTLTCMADSLLALLNAEANTSWNELLVDTNRQMAELANRKGQGSVLAMGSYALHKPTTALVQAMAWRMVRDVLFETALGLHPLETMTSDGDYQELPEAERGKPLKDRSLSLESLETLVAKYRDNWHTAAFDAAVRTRINALLNGEQDDIGEPAVGRRAGLEQARKWLKYLQSQLVLQGAEGIARQVSDLRAQLARWQTWFETQVHPLCEQRFLVAREELQRLQSQPARSWGLDHQLEWPYYRQNVRRWDVKPMGNAQGEPLLRLSARFGWEVEVVPEGWRPRLLIPPGEFDERVDVKHLDLLRQYEILPEHDPVTFLDHLYELAERAVPFNEQTTAAELALLQDMTQWVERATPRLAYNPDEANRLMDVVNQLTMLIAPESAEHTPRLAEKLQGVPGIAGELVVCPTDDPTTVTLIQATSWLPLSSVDLYSEETWQNYAVPYTLYVHRPEQMTAEMEQDGRLSALLLDRIEENEPLLRAYGLAILYGAVRERTGGWEIPGIEDQVATLWVGLERVLAGDDVALDERLHALNEAVDRCRQGIASRLAYLKQAEEERVKPLLESQSARERELGIYVQGLIVGERQR